jgi:uncharacterized membrane-anchored protein YitT (DUF2179 family)
MLPNSQWLFDTCLLAGGVCSYSITMQEALQLQLLMLWLMVNINLMMLMSLTMQEALQL